MPFAVTPRAGASPRKLPALDALNFLLADVQGGVGPFLAIFLTSSRGWSAGLTGVVLTAAGLATVAALGPVGALVDRIRWKRTLVTASCGVVAVSALVPWLWSGFWPVMLSQAANGVADAVFGPAVVAISLGLVGRAAFTARNGRNQAFNHAGNVVTAVLAGVGGWLLSPAAALWFVALLSGVSVAATLAIDARRIDHRAARGAVPRDGEAAPSGLATILGCRPLLVFTCCCALFHLSNAAMLPLVGEKLARDHITLGGHGTSTLFISACIVTAQAVMVPVAVLCGHKADRWGRRPLYAVGFASLAVRGILFAVLQNPFLLVAAETLDGIGAGAFGALFPLVVADLTRGTGRFNLAQGASSAVWGLGAALSNGMAGWIVSAAGFRLAFLVLAGIGAAATLLFLLAVPETLPRDETEQAGAVRTGAAQA